MSQRLEQAGRRFARLATRAVVARPWLWGLFRAPLRVQFDRLAPIWDARRGPEAHAALESALDRLEIEPRRVLDLGTGTGQAPRYIAARFRTADVVGVDQSPAMIEEARRLLPEDIGDRVRFEVADAAHLPFADAAFDLVVLLNMIPFFEEIARLTAPDGSVVFAFSSGAETPMYTPPDVLRRRLAPLGFTEFEEIAAGEGTALLARRGIPG